MGSSSSLNNSLFFLHYKYRFHKFITSYLRRYNESYSDAANVDYANGKVARKGIVLRPGEGLVNIVIAIDR